MPDRRRAEGKLYQLPHVLLFAILGIVSGCNSYRGIVTFIDVHRRSLSISPAALLTEALGIGILSAALKHGTLEPDLYQVMVGSATTLNVLGADTPVIEGVHAITNATGFGLLGHALEITRPDGLSLRIALGDLPLLPGVVGLVSSGMRTGASGRNWSSFGHEVTLSAELPAWAFDLLCDPQTSRGLLIAAAPDAVPLVLEKAAARGIAAAAVIGTFEAASGILVA